MFILDILGLNETAIARVLTTRNYGSASQAGLQLLRIVNGKAWEDQASVFQQLRNIGPKSMKVLGANNVLCQLKSSDDLFEKTDGRFS